MKTKNKKIFITLFSLITLSLIITSIPISSQGLTDLEMRALGDMLDPEGLEDERMERADPFIFDKTEFDIGRKNPECLYIDPTTRGCLLWDNEARDNEFKVTITRPTSFDQQPATRDLSSDLKAFGYDLFSKATSTFAPASDIPIPNDYVIGPGDNIKIFLFGNTNVDYDLQVSREGDVYFPEVGIVSLAGLTFAQAKQTISDRVKNQTLGSEVVVSLGKLRSITIFILGDAYQPGSYLISGLSTLSNALFVSGGVSTSGSLRKIQHKRNGEIVSNFDIYDLLLKGDTSNDTRLQSGDVIFIPSITNRIAVSGEVYRPGLYELLENEDIESLISYAGGLKPSANLGVSQIDTVTESGLSLKKVNLNDNRSFKLIPNNGDILHILPFNNVYQDAILLSNYLRSPGFIPWSDNSRILDLVDPSVDLLNDTDRRYVLVKSIDKKTGNYTFKQSNLEEALADMNSSDNLQLSKNDEIYFFKNIEDKLDDEDVVEDLKSEERDGLISEMKPAEAQIPMSIEEAEMLEASDEVEILEDKPEATHLSRAEVAKMMTGILENQSSPGKPAKIVNILGARYPGKYPLTEGMTVQDAIHASGGLGDNTVLAEAEYIQVIFNNNNEYAFQRRQLSLENPNDLNIKLKPGSTISFKAAPKLTRTVKVEGEVVFPGEYLLSKGEKLSDLIERAGGLTDNAYPYGAYFTRENLVEADKRRIDQAKKLFEQQILYTQISSGGIGQQAASINPETLSLFGSEQDEEFLGRLILDLEKILSSGNNDIFLEDGDLLRIPSKPNSISVIGEVNVPATHVYKEGQGLNFYLSLSGEVNQFAAKDNIYVIAANGAIKPLGDNSGFFRANNSGLKPGDTIVVPLNVSTFSGVQAANEITSIIYQLAVAAAAVSSF